MAKQTKNTKVLAFDFVINTLLTVIEIVAGSISGSVALLADGFQNLTDSIVISIAFFTERLTSRKGVKKGEKAKIHRYAGSINATLLIFLSLFVGYFAIYRIFHPHKINTSLVIAVGILSISINWYAAALLYSRRNQKSIRAPYIGLLFSGLSGVGVLVSGLATRYLGAPHIDGVIGVLIALVLFLRATNLFKRSLAGK